MIRFLKEMGIVIGSLFSNEPAGYVVQELRKMDAKKEKPRIRFCDGYILRPVKVSIDESHIDEWLYANGQSYPHLRRDVGVVYIDGSEAIKKLSTLAP